MNTIIKKKPGRPKGSLGKKKGIGDDPTTAIVKASIEKRLSSKLADDIELIMAKAVSLAQEGDKVMIKFLLERFMSAASNERKDVEKLTGGIQIIVNPMPTPEANVEVTAKIIEGSVIDQDQT